MSDPTKEPLVLVACGSYSPVTFLHLRMFEMARDYIHDQSRFELLGAYFSPVSSGYKKPGLALYKHRVRMLELATLDSDWLMVDSWEARQAESQRTALVLEHFEAMINGEGWENGKVGSGGVVCGGVKRRIRIMLLAGGDLIQSFASYEIRDGVKMPVWLPSDLDHILGKFGCMIIERTGADVHDFLLQHQSLYDHRKQVFVVKQFIYNDISSTKVRLFVKRQMSIKYLLPEKVRDYILKTGLYLVDEPAPEMEEIVEDEEGVVEESEEARQVAEKREVAYLIFGIVGLKKLNTGWHLIVVAKKRYMGSLIDKGVYRLEKVAIVPVEGKGAESILERFAEEFQEEKKRDTSPVRKSPTSPPLSSAPPSTTSELQPSHTPVPPPRSPTPTAPSTPAALLKKPSTSSLQASLQTLFTPRSRSPSPSRAPAASPAQLKDAKLIRDLAAFLGSSCFFLSYTDDLTLSLQRKHEIQESRDAPLWTRADPRFFWNMDCTEALMKTSGAERFVLPIMQGFVQLNVNCQIDDAGFVFALISRRSKERAGLRYLRRGVNGRGDVANFVETEMIILSNYVGQNHHVSFVQVRGSVPLFWKQIAAPNVLNPPPILEPSDEENQRVMDQHFTSLEQLYGNVLIVDLLEHHGRESPLSEKYRSILSKIRSQHPNVQYRDFAFHSHTKGLQYDNVKKLIAMLETEFSSTQYFWSANGQVMCKQNGVFRTNCMDCLDRTNVVQSTLAGHILNMMLFRLGIQPNPELGIVAHRGFDSIFKDIWANNGDYISMEYTGTGALKSDFTRTGSRNLKGVLTDAQLSLTRLYADNFTNHLKQTTIDVFLGRRNVENLGEGDDGEESANEALLPIMSHALAMSSKSVSRKALPTLWGLTSRELYGQRPGYNINISKRPLVKRFYSSEKWIFEHRDETQNNGPYFACAYSNALNDGKYLAVADEDGYVGIIDATEPNDGESESQGRYEWAAHNNAIFDICWSSDDKFLLTASGDQTARVWDIERQSCKCLKVVDMREWIDILATASRDGAIKIWDVRCTGNVVGDDYHHSAIDIIANAHSLANSRPGLRAKKKDNKHISHGVTALQFLKHNTNLLASAGAVDGTYRDHDFPVPVEKSCLPEGSKRAYGLTSLSLNESGTKLYAACYDDSIHEYSTTHLSHPTQTFSAPTLSTSSFYITTTLSPCGSFLASGSKDSNIHIFETHAPWKPPVLLKGHKAEASCVVWCPSDFGQMASVSDDGSVRVWSVRTAGEEQAEMEEDETGGMYKDLRGRAVEGEVSVEVIKKLEKRRTRGVAAVVVGEVSSGFQTGVGGLVGSDNGVLGSTLVEGSSRKRPADSFLRASGLEAAAHGSTSLVGRPGSSSTVSNASNTATKKKKKRKTSSTNNNQSLRTFFSTLPSSPLSERPLQSLSTSEGSNSKPTTSTQEGEPDAAQIAEDKENAT
ncbi:Phosphoinositide phosphatase sac1 [Chytridiales sp. JEL 0842]|nr:Phosphoinositide phosphatase sac1 [Chytridiales sp. JEL 0842]